VKPDDREQLFRDGFEAWVSGDMERALELTYQREVSN